MGEFNIWMLLAGIGLLLFGMGNFESGIKALAGNKMKLYLEQYTRGARRSLTTGTLVTALLQSSSLVTLLLLGFLGAGLINLPNAIGVIIGANVGTTVSSLMVGFLGFGEFKISAFAMPIIAIGGILLLTSGKSEKRLWRGKLLIGFGLLFIGIGYMKESVDALKDSFDLTAYKDMSLRGFGLLGVVVTIVVQSSSAMSVMTFAALASGIITFPASIAIVMGSNIGTTLTGVIASFGGATSKRQLAVGQVLFNVISAGIGILLFWQLIHVTELIMPIHSTPVMANAVLNTIFNLLTALLFAPFLMPFTALVRRIIPDDIPKTTTLAIDELPADQVTDLTTQTYLGAVHTDVDLIQERVLEYMRMSVALEYDEQQHISWYDETQMLAQKVLTYLRDLDLSMQQEVGIQHRLVGLVRGLKHIKNVVRNMRAVYEERGSEFEKLAVLLQETITGFAQDPEQGHSYIKQLDEYYLRHLESLVTLGNQSENPNVDGASLINMVREVEQAMERVSG